MNKPGSPSLLSRLLGRNTGNSSPFAAIFSHLDQIEKGLSGKLATYIETGEGRTVLATLQANEPAVDKIVRTLSSGDYSACYARSKQENTLLFQFPGNPEGLARYIEALYWGCESKGKYYVYGFEDAKIPPLVVEIIGRFNQDFQPDSNTFESTTHKDLIAATKQLGGCPAHLVVAIAFGHLKFTYQGVSLEQYLMEGDPAGVIEGFMLIDTSKRVSAMPKLLNYTSATNPAYLDFLFRQMAAGSARLREAARVALARHDPDLVQSMATDGLTSSKAAVRKTMVQVLGSLGGESALAVLKKHREEEKTQSVLALIDQMVAIAPAHENLDLDKGAYLAVDGTRVDIPPMLELTDDGAPVLTAEDLAELKQREQEDYDTKLKRYRERGERTWIEKPTHLKRAQVVFDLFTGKIPLKPHGPNSPQDLPTHFMDLRLFADWLQSALGRIPSLRALRICFAYDQNFTAVFHGSGWPPHRDRAAWLTEAMAEGVFDLRHLVKEAAALNVVIKNHRAEIVELSPAGLIESYCADTSYGLSWATSTAGIHGAWPLFAEHLELIASFLPPVNTNAYQNEKALALLKQLPKLPKSLLQNILSAAIGESCSVREMAQELLKDAPDVDETLIATLVDKRQTVRGNAARFLADRGTKTAVPGLARRLKTEKSDFARAEMISAIARLGGDTAPYLGREALLAEAEKLVAKLPLGKLDWLVQSQAPALTWADGKPVPPVLMDAWLRLALKLKAPGGSPLFDLYLDQMNQGDVALFAEWLLSHWIACDTEVGSKAAASKGILALAHRAPPVKLGAMIAAYLKDHGARLSQAKALLEVLLKSGSPEAVQLLVAVSTRFKQRSIQEFAQDCVLKLAEARGWSEDELADRSVPSGGFEQDGTMTLAVGDSGKRYTAQLDSSLKVQVFNPDGREVKGLPAGKDTQTKEAKKMLSQAKKTIKTVTSQQAARLYDGMLGSRNWPIDAWRNDLNTHPILNRLTERAIWRGLDEAGEMKTSFRPTPEGDFFDAEGEDADLTGVVTVDLMHSALIDEPLRAAWTQHLEDFEITPLFPQISRSLQVLSEAQKSETELTDRKGWLMEALRLRSAATKFGYDRGPVEDAASFDTYQKAFRNLGITAQLHFTGSYMPEENIPVAIIDMQFIRDGDNYANSALQLGQVPPLLLSEVWNDLHEIAAYGAFDAEWEQKGLYS
ncbi:DUF4132 domain-containing protein [uncultured Microbulbifer sp.]|uniref:DUF4132 domain-containing protein n=1 Tax=uncultured Microbulbifer sp. TaxID=348147 RepID=UPI0026387105|nr:DUF4132 domain-containing protein [uncultured Microbulbifer sp.]